MKHTTHILALIALVITASLPVSAQRTEGHWVDPVEYFKLKGKGRLAGDQLSDYMWETKERHIVGMKCTTCNFTPEGDSPEKADLPITQQTYYLYVDQPTGVAAVSDWAHVANQHGTTGTGKGAIWKIGASDLTFSFDEKSNHYSFFYYPEGSMSDTDDQGEVLDKRDIGMFYSDQGGLIIYFLNVYYHNTDWDEGPNGELVDIKGEDSYYLQLTVDEVLLDGTDTPLTESERIALVDRMNDLVTWLRGEGDPLGLGEHTGPMETAVIESIGTIGSLLLANGLASVAGGTGASGVGGLLGNVGGGGGTPSPMPNIPDTPNFEAPDPKGKKDDEETPEDGPSEEPPVDDGKFHSTNYPELCDKYIRQNEDGTLTMNDPITGKPLTYYPTGQGEWESEMGTKYNRESLEENLRYRYENSDVLKQDADLAAKNVAEQHAKWQSDAERDLKRGYTDKMQEYRDWKEQYIKEEAAKQLKDDYLNRLADKYQVKPDEKVLRHAIETEQKIAEWEHDDHMDWDRELADKEAYVNKIDKGAELAVNVMGECVPGGRVVKNAYTFAKSVGVGFSEGCTKGDGIGDVLKSTAYGAVDGALGVMQNQAGEITGSTLVEGTIVVGGESARAGLKAISEGKSPEEINQAMADAAGKKLGYYVTGKAVSGGLGLMGKGGSGGDGGFTNTGTAGTVEKYFGKNGMSGNWSNLDDGMHNVVNVTEGIASGVQETGATFGAYDGMGEIAKANEHDVNEFVKDVTEFSNRASQYRRR